jgi:AcrR family transcriptional regulator
VEDEILPSMVVDEANKAESSSEVARHIARTAARLFAKQGYEATSVREIVEAAGVTKPTLYYHFGSKEGLANALLNVPLSGLVETFRGIATAGADPISTLERIIEAHFVFCREEPDRARMYYAVCFGPLGADLAEQLFKYVESLDWPIRETVRRMVAEGFVPAERAEDFLWVCRGLITSTVMDLLYKDREIGPDLPLRLVHDLLYGFAPNRTSSEKQI